MESLWEARTTPSSDYHIIPIPIDMGSTYGTTKCGLPYNSHRYEKYMGQPSVDYHIIPIDMESISDNQVWTTI